MPSTEKDQGDNRMKHYTNVRISRLTSERMNSVLAKSRLSRDQFVDYLLIDALDQIEGTTPPGILPHVNTVRRENGLPPLAMSESILDRLRMLETLATASARHHDGASA
jgi:hypothetical protein